MAALGKKLRSYTDGYGGRGLMHWCPACQMPHGVQIERGSGPECPIWDWNKDIDKPSIFPSIRLMDLHHSTYCHYFIADGEIKYCNDCRHGLSGKTVEIPDWPYAPHTYGGIDENDEEVKDNPQQTPPDKT